MHKTLRHNSPLWFGLNSYMTKPMKTVLMKISFFCTKWAKDLNFTIFETMKITDFKWWKTEGKEYIKEDKRVHEEKGWYSFFGGNKTLRPKSRLKAVGVKFSRTPFSHIQTYTFLLFLSCSFSLPDLKSLFQGSKITFSGHLQSLASKIFFH